MRKLLRYMTLYDKILIIFIISLSLVFIVLPVINNLNVSSKNQNDNNKYIIIQSGEKIVKKISIAKTYQKKPILIEIKGSIGTSLIEAHQGRVRIKKAPETDPMKVCEKTGWIENFGPSIICVPNQISIWIKTISENNIDGITY